MKILNLYAGIGGNRKLWGDEHEITAVELDPDIAKIYLDLYPQDEVVVADAHDFLLNYFGMFDFIWSSPPCPTHGQYRYNVGVKAKGYKAVFSDMKLYEEIIFLQYYFTGKWVVENVKPFYEPLVKPSVVLQRHLFWSNFDIPEIKTVASGLRVKNKISDFQGYEVVANSKIKNKRQVLRNCVNSEVGKYILDQLESQL